jgi:hypothetical protein
MGAGAALTKPALAVVDRVTEPLKRRNAAANGAASPSRSPLANGSGSMIVAASTDRPPTEEPSFSSEAGERRTA